MPRERISDGTKRRIFEAHENQGDYMEVARVLGVKCGTAWSFTLGPNTTCILAVSAIRGIIHQEFRQGGVTADIFNAFMQRTIEETGDGYVTFILSNAPCH